MLPPDDSDHNELIEPMIMQFFFRLHKHGYIYRFVYTQGLCNKEVAKFLFVPAWDCSKFHV